MAWRPTEHLIEGELDNTTPGKVTGWMQFAGRVERVTFALEGNFHRDIRGAKIHLRGIGRPDNPEAAPYMDSFSDAQTGRVGDMTAGLAPRDYVPYPYLEWYSNENGRVVIELEPEQLEVIGRPIPACESDPISRAEQQQNMAHFLAGLSAELNVPAILVGRKETLVSDPAFTHWVIEEGRIVGEAHSVEPRGDHLCFAYVRLNSMPELAEFGTMANSKLRPKNVSQT